jgi:small subunit ribosomal protein S9
MADDKTPDETTEGQEPQDAGPVAEETSSASQASAEEAPSTPPASEAPDADAESPTEAESANDEPAPEAEEPSEGSPAEEQSPEQAEPEAVEEAPAAEEPSEEAQPEPVAEEAPAAEETLAAEEAPAEEPAAPAEAPKVEKKDVIPGADLEPIAVEPEAPQLSAEERARLEAEEEEKARREAELASSDEPASRAPAKMESDARFLATGKRKRSIARVTLLPGSGKIEVNKRSLEEFFPRPLHQTMAVQPLAVSGYEGNVDVRVRVHGGGISGQAGAVRHGIARALTEIDPELRGDLKRRGFLTRDARVKERRKAGLKKARKRPQFSKR